LNPSGENELVFKILLSHSTCTAATTRKQIKKWFENRRVSQKRLKEGTRPPLRQTSSSLKAAAAAAAAAAASAPPARNPKSRAYAKTPPRASKKKTSHPKKQKPASTIGKVVSSSGVVKRGRRVRSPSSSMEIDPGYTTGKLSAEAAEDVVDATAEELAAAAAAAALVREQSGMMRAMSWVGLAALFTTRTLCCSQNTVQSMTASVVHVSNLTPGSAKLATLVTGVCLQDSRQRQNQRSPSGCRRRQRNRAMKHGSFHRR
jgi:hypothetical protein